MGELVSRPLNTVELSGAVHAALENFPQAKVVGHVTRASDGLMIFKVEMAGLLIHVDADGNVERMPTEGEQFQPTKGARK